ncbi:unnamed protein product [Linum trigynum]|uniref:Uncharacterized protein n=1 Tax=Linum trigynum TaxID=586398 RepID=A0AAV2E282_9ROSI
MHNKPLDRCFNRLPKDNLSLIKSVLERTLVSFEPNLPTNNVKDAVDHPITKTVRGFRFPASNNAYDVVNPDGNTKLSQTLLTSCHTSFPNLQLMKRWSTVSSSRHQRMQRFTICPPLFWIISCIMIRL